MLSEDEFIAGLCDFDRCHACNTMRYLDKTKHICKDCWALGKIPVTFEPEDDDNSDSEYENSGDDEEESQDESEFTCDVCDKDLPDHEKVIAVSTQQTPKSWPGDVTETIFACGPACAMKHIHQTWKT